MPSFGYSVGDCIASVDLLVRILKSLRETGGASSEFQQLQVDLNFLGEVLEQLKIVDLVSTNASVDQTAKAAKFVHASQATLSALLDRVSKFKESLAVGATSGRFSSALRKAQWALIYSEDVAKLRQLLASQTASLTLFLEAQNIGFTKAVALNLSTSQNQVASATASQASSLHRLEASMSRLSCAAKGRCNTWETNQRLQYSEMIHKLAEIENNMRVYVSSSYEDHRSALIRSAEETTTQGNRHQQALQLVASSIKEQKSIFGLEFGRLRGSIGTNNEEMTSLCQTLQSSTRALEEVTQDLRQHQKRQRPRFVNNESLGLLSSHFDSNEGSLDSECQEVSSGIPSFGACQANERPNRVMNDMGAHIADLVSSIIIGMLVLLWAIFRTVFFRFQQLGYSITLYKYPKLVITDCIQLFDALGRVRILQYDVCRNWRIFKAILRNQFKHFPGYRKVKMGEFVLLDLRSNTILPEEKEWSHSIFPGSKIAMSMVITQLVTIKGKCPRPSCGANVKAKPGQVTIKCPECELNFSPVRKIFTGVSPDQPGIQESGGRKWEERLALPIGELRRALEIEELSFYRRVHIKEALLPAEETPVGPFALATPMPEVYTPFSPDVRCLICGHKGCSTCEDYSKSYRYTISPEVWVCCGCGGVNLLTITG